jgi:hypothetical protein
MGRQPGTSPATHSPIITRDAANRASQGVNELQTVTIAQPDLPNICESVVDLALTLLSRLA